MPTVELAVEHPRAVHDQPGDRRLHVEHLGGAAVEDEAAVVALLAAGLGVERRDVDDDADLVARDGRRQQRAGVGSISEMTVDSWRSSSYPMKTVAPCSSACR